MIVALHHEPRLAHQKEWLGYFAKGMQEHGHRVRMKEGFDPVDCDLAVFWSIHPRTMAIRENQKRNGNRFIVMERGFIGDRTKWASVGYDDIAGYADFCNENSPSDRWDKKTFDVEDWNPGSEYILLIGQVPTDSSLRGLDWYKWHGETVRELQRIQKLPVRLRPHPIMDRNYKRSLAEDLESAACIVTYCSTTGVQAIEAGKPVIALSEGAMCYPVSGHSLEDVLKPPTPDRDQWLYDLMYAQWHKRELSTGRCWEHLKKGLE